LVEYAAGAKPGVVARGLSASFFEI